MDIHISRCLKVNGVGYYSDIMLFQTAIATTKKLKNKAVLSLTNTVYVAIWSLPTYSNYFVIYYRLMQHGSTIKVYFMFSSV